MILITGGAKSGKSDFAEKMLPTNTIGCYIATSGNNQHDPEMKKRILIHQKKRGKNWQTEERFLKVSQFLYQTNNKFSFYLIDCATLLSTNLFFYWLKQKNNLSSPKKTATINSLTQTDYDSFEKILLTNWHNICTTISNLSSQVVIVTNELGMGIVPVSKLGRAFRDLLGKVNQLLAKKADSVYFMVSGIPLKIK